MSEPMPERTESAQRRWGEHLSLTVGERGRCVGADSFKGRCVRPAGHRDECLYSSDVNRRRR